ITGRCSLFGRHHIHTFDGVIYEFPGDCSYLLAGDCNHQSFTLLELGFFKLWSVEFGFSVTIDNAANIALTLTKRHSNRTCGLCGNFNAVPADEYTAQEEDSYDFANSWAVKGADQACRRVSDPTQSCNSTKETAAVLSSCSVLQSSSVFLHCSHLVSPDAFLSLCQAEACHCDQKNAEDCSCPFLLEYARTCRAHEILLHGWVEESQCLTLSLPSLENMTVKLKHGGVVSVNSMDIQTPMNHEMECRGGQVYEACGSTCERTCRSLSGAEPGCEGERVCEEGCFCPAGKYLSTSGECVTADMCSCLHDGQLYQPSDVYADHNSIWQSVIRVKRGWSVPGPARIWTCHVSVLPASLAASVHKAQVLVENEACGIVGHRCAKAVTIFYQGGLIVMQDGEVDAEPYVEMCVEAACSCSSVGDCSCFCDVIAAYAQACSEKDVSVMWRSNDLCRQLLDEVDMRCVDPSHCQVCIHEGQRISHGNKVILNHNDPIHCKIW
ncbi:hypothetical protein GOODEAATRI_018846, partial [Goodea atripinnis]